MARRLGLNAKSKFSDSALLIIQLCKTLPILLTYFLFVDNFFSSIKLFKTLRSLEIAASEIAKKKSDFPKKLLAFRDVTSKKINWSLQTHMIVDGVFCLSWIDNNPVQFMTTSHLVEDLS